MIILKIVAFCLWTLGSLAAQANNKMTSNNGGSSSLFEGAVWTQGSFMLDGLPSILTRDQMLHILENFTLLMAAMAPRGPPGPKGDPGRCECVVDDDDIPAEFYYKSSSKSDKRKRSKRFGPKSKQLKNKPGKRPITSQTKNNKKYPQELLSAVEITNKLKKMLKKVSMKG